MRGCNFEPYEGDEAYIFISYSHKDAQKVFPILNKLNAYGFRIWYDDGLEWGKEWPQDIADHIDVCDVFVIFLSQNSMESLCCREEFRRACEKNKSIFPIYLEKVNLNYEIQEKIEFIQAAEFYNYNLNELQTFYEKLINATILLPSQKNDVSYLLYRASTYHDEKDLYKAMEFYLKAANKGNVLAAAMVKNEIKKIPGFKPLEKSEEETFIKYLNIPQKSYDKKNNFTYLRNLETIEDFQNRIKNKVQ